MEFAEYISVHQVDNVLLTDKTDDNRKGSSIEGTLCITGHHLILSSRQAERHELWVRNNISNSQWDYSDVCRIRYIPRIRIDKSRKYSDIKNVRHLSSGR